jgi:putative cardiolipin synthase
VKTGTAVAKVARRVAAALLALTLGACASLPPLEGRSVSTAIPAETGTPLREAVGPGIDAHPGLSGIYALDDARAAFAARVGLAEAAVRTLDVQYYIWHDDVSGRLLLETLRRAAERGVRVRLLLDDNNTSGLDPTIAALDALENVEVRLFNPFPNRSFRMLGFATDFGRLNRRMHNKSFTADGVATIVGGRNVGDEYFAAGDGVGFVDLDVIAVGPVVRQVQASFDEYWNGASSYPANRIVPAATPEDVARLATQGTAVLESAAGSKYLDAVRETDFIRQILGGGLDFTWCEAELIVDAAAKGLGRAARKDLVLARLERLVGDAKQDLYVVSPYFVPTKAGSRVFEQLARDGVKVSILTNALEATDVAAVHAGYAKHREALLRAGVDLWELKRSAGAPPRKRGFRGSGGSAAPDGNGSGDAHPASDDAAAVKRTKPRGSSPPGESSGASLHAKTFAVDRERVFVGSFNFDPRSAALNTEMGLLIRSPVLAQRLVSMFDDAIPRNAYEVKLRAGGGLEWHERTPEGDVVRDVEPNTTGFQRFTIGVLQLLPIDWLL